MSVPPLPDVVYIPNYHDDSIIQCMQEYELGRSFRMSLIASHKLDGAGNIKLSTNVRDMPDLIIPQDQIKYLTGDTVPQEMDCLVFKDNKQFFIASNHQAQFIHHLTGHKTHLAQHGEDEIVFSHLSGGPVENTSYLIEGGYPVVLKAFVDGKFRDPENIEFVKTAIAAFEDRSMLIGSRPSTGRYFRSAAHLAPPTIETSIGRVVDITYNEHLNIYTAKLIPNDEESFQSYLKANHGKITLGARYLQDYVEGKPKLKEFIGIDLIDPE